MTKQVIVKKLYVGEDVAISTSYEQAMQLGAEGFKHVYEAIYGDVHEHYIFATEEVMDEIIYITEKLWALEAGDTYEMEDGTILIIQYA